MTPSGLQGILQEMIITMDYIWNEVKHRNTYREGAIEDKLEKLASEIAALTNAR